MTDETTSTATRWAYTNDVLAGVLVGFAVVLTAAFVAQARTVPMWLATVDTVAIGTAVVWSFGKGAFESAKDLLGGGNA